MPRKFYGKWGTCVSLLTPSVYSAICEIQRKAEKNIYQNFETKNKLHVLITVREYFYTVDTKNIVLWKSKKKMLIKYIFYLYSIFYYNNTNIIS